MNNSPFTVMKHEIYEIHEIIVSIYDSGYRFDIMIDNTNPPNKFSLRDAWQSWDHITFIKVIANISKWKTGDSVRLILCEDGKIETALVRVNNGYET